MPVRCVIHPCLISMCLKLIFWLMAHSACVVLCVFVCVCVCATSMCAASAGKNSMWFAVQKQPFGLPTPLMQQCRHTSTQTATAVGSRNAAQLTMQNLRTHSISGMMSEVMSQEEFTIARSAPSFIWPRALPQSWPRGHERLDGDGY